MLNPEETPFNGSDYAFRSGSTASIVSSASPPEDQPRSASFMSISDSLSSSRSEISNKSTFSNAAAKFFTSHKPHIPHHHHHHKRSEADISKDPRASNLAMEERKPHHMLPTGDHHHHHHHYYPFKLLSRSTTHVDSQLQNQSFSAASTVAGSPEPVQYEDSPELAPEDQRAPPNSTFASPSSKPVGKHLNPRFKLQRDKLLAQYQFFVKFQQNAKRSDAIDYAPLRLESMNEFLADVYDEAREKILKQKEQLGKKLPDVSEKSSVTGSTISLNRYATLTNIQRPYDLENIQPVKSTETSRTLDTIETTSSMSSEIVNGQLSPERTRQALMQLWVVQAWKLLVGSLSLIIPVIREGSINNFKKHTKNSMIKKRHQICFLQNQIRHGFEDKVAGESIGDENGLDESELSWMMGWQLAYDEPDSWVNNVFLTDWDLTSRIILDENCVGQISEEAPQLSDDLQNLRNSPIVHLSQHKKAEFCSNYSLFTTNSYKTIPLKSKSQHIVYCYDLEQSVLQNDWLSTLEEIKRVLAPGGFVQFVIRDFEIHNESGGVTETSASKKIWNVIRSNVEKEGFELRPTRKILKWLKDSDFKEVKYSLLTAPKTVTPIRNIQIENNTNWQQQQNRRTSSSSSFVTNSNSNSTLSVPHTRASSTTSELMSFDSLKPQQDESLPNKPSDQSLSSSKTKSSRTSVYKDERLNNFSSLVTGLGEFKCLNSFTNLRGTDTPVIDDDTLLEYLNYRDHGDGSSKIFYDEGYMLYMNVTAKI